MGSFEARYAEPTEEAPSTQCNPLPDGSLMMTRTLEEALAAARTLEDVTLVRRYITSWGGPSR